MLLGMGLLTAACVFLGLFPTLFLTLFDPLTQQLIGQPLSRAYLSLADGWVLGNTQATGGTVSTLGIALMGLCLLPMPLVLWLFFGRRTQVRIGPDLGLRAARADAADGIHRHRLLQADPDDLQGAVPAAARGAAGV